MAEETEGIAPDGKNVPDSSHIGGITRFISPDTLSIVFGLDAANNPIPANVMAPANETAARLISEPRTATPPNTDPSAPAEIGCSYYPFRVLSTIDAAPISLSDLVPHCLITSASSR